MSVGNCSSCSKHIPYSGGICAECRERYKKQKEEKRLKDIEDRIKQIEDKIKDIEDKNKEIEDKVKTLEIRVKSLGDLVIMLKKNWKYR